MIYEKIKTLRQERGITQAELARDLGITRAGVNAWEMGLSVPSTQYLAELARYFRVSTDFLLGLDNSATVSVAGLTQEDIRLVRRLIDHLIEKNKTAYQK